MRAFVTGAAGFIGSHLSERLIEAGHEVVGLDSFTDYYARSIKESNIASLKQRRQFRFIEDSLLTADLGNLLDGVTHVFHLAAQAGVRKSWGTDFAVYTKLNIGATQCLLEACVNHSLERIVFASSSSVYGDAVPIPMLETARPAPLSPYGVTKLAAEHLCMLYHANYAVPTVAIRYFTVYGPRQRPDMAFHRFLRAILDNKPLSLYGDGEQTRDFTFVEDAVAATIAAADRGTNGTVYNVGGGSRVSMNEILDVMAQCTGKSPNVHRQETQRGDMRDTFADTTRARTELGFAPRVILKDGILAEYQWLTSAIGTL